MASKKKSKKAAKGTKQVKTKLPPIVDERKYTSYGLRNLRRKGLIR